MKPAKGYYCLIQYCPDLSRLEAANIGVLLFCPEPHFLKARTARGHRWLQRFFGSEGHDWSRIESFKIAIEERLEVENGTIRTLKDLEKFISLRANRIQITPPRPMQVHDPEKDLDQLFQELIGGEHRKQKATSLRRYLADRFSRANLEQKLKKDIRVTVPVLEREIEVPYGYQNGRLNLIQPARFRGADPKQALTTACKYAVEGRSLYEHPDPNLGELQLVVVGDFGTKPAESKAIVGRILVENAVRLFPANELDCLIEEIRQTAKDVANNGQANPLT
jgi:hypothetical protein